MQLYSHQFHDSDQFHGFTLTELLTIVMVMAVILSLAIPSFTHTIENAKINAAVERLTNSMRLAQSASARTGEDAYVCASTDGATCNGGSNWSDGWIVVEQENGVIRVLKVEEPVHDSISLESVDFTDTNRITFTSFGNVIPGVAPGVFTVCDTRGSLFAKGIVITEAGIVRPAMDTDGDGVVEKNTPGDDISC